MSSSSNEQRVLVSSLRSRQCSGIRILAAAAVTDRNDCIGRRQLDTMQQRRVEQSKQSMRKRRVERRGSKAQKRRCRAEESSVRRLCTLS